MLCLRFRSGRHQWVKVSLCCQKESAPLARACVCVCVCNCRTQGEGRHIENKPNAIPIASCETPPLPPPPSTPPLATYPRLTSARSNFNVTRCRCRCRSGPFWPSFNFNQHGQISPVQADPLPSPPAPLCAGWRGACASNLAKKTRRKTKRRKSVCK